MSTVAPLTATTSGHAIWDPDRCVPRRPAARRVIGMMSTVSAADTAILR